LRFPIIKVLAKINEHKRSNGTCITLKSLKLHKTKRQTKFFKEHKSHLKQKHAPISFFLRSGAASMKKYRN